MATFEDLSVFDERNGELAINGIVCGYFVGLWPLLWMIESYHTPSSSKLAWTRLARLRLRLGYSRLRTLGLSFGCFQFPQKFFIKFCLFPTHCGFPTLYGLKLVCGQTNRTPEIRPFHMRYK
jgi:hypothetical protein